jgi:regulator of telomere elongation helicase 1
MRLFSGLQEQTGTGKTLCLLASTISWVYSEKMQGRHPKIIYFSRTHTQLHQIQKELNKTCFRPSMGHVDSREILCIKPKRKYLKSRDLIEECTTGVRLAKLKRQGKLDWDKMDES